MPEVAAITGAMKFDFSQYMKGMMQVQSLTAIFPQCVTNFIANPLLGLVGIFKDATRTIAGWVGNLAEAADSADDLAASVGMNVEFMTAFARVAELNGASLQDVGQAAQFLNRSMAEAAAGGDKAKVFGDLGVKFRNSAGGMRTAEEVILDVGEALKNLPDAAKRTDMAMDLLGRGAGPMITVFMQGKAAIEDQMNTFRQLGGVTTVEEAKIASAFMDTANMVGKAWEGVKKALAIPLMQGLTPHLQMMVDWFKTNPDAMKQKMQDLANGIVNAFKLVGATVEFLLNNLNAVIIASTTLAGVWAGFKIGGGIGAIAGGAAGLGAGMYLTRNTGGAGAGGGGGVVIQNLNVQAPPLDQATTTRIAGSLQAPLRDAMHQQQTDYEGQFKAAAMAGGI